MPERILSQILELDVDRCQNVYGVAPCTAAGAPGTECYNTLRTCQDRPHYVRGVQTIRFTGIGSPIPSGVAARPYVESVERSPTKLDPDEGLAVRASTKV